MRRGWMQTTGWTLATAAMVAMSWYGVHSVLAEPDGGSVRTAYSSPSLPADGASPDAPASPSPSASSPSASASASPSPSATTHPAAPPTATRSAPAAPPPATGERTYTVTGGSVVLDLAPSSAALVSVTPRPGWSVKEFKEQKSIRVMFFQDQRFSSVSCSWDGHPPIVQTYSG